MIVYNVSYSDFISIIIANVAEQMCSYIASLVFRKSYLHCDPNVWKFLSTL